MVVGIQHIVNTVVTLRLAGVRNVSHIFTAALIMSYAMAVEIRHIVNTVVITLRGE